MADKTELNYFYSLFILNVKQKSPNTKLLREFFGDLFNVCVWNYNPSKVSSALYFSTDHVVMSNGNSTEYATFQPAYYDICGGKIEYENFLYPYMKPDCCPYCGREIFKV